MYSLTGKGSLKQSAPSQSQIIADHNAVDGFDDIPSAYLADVRDMFLNMIGESHALAFQSGLVLVEALGGTAYAFDNANQDPPALTVPSEGVRSSRYLYRTTTGTYDDYPHSASAGWSDNGGSEDFWTTPEAVQQVANHILYMRDTASNPVSVIGFGWCRDTFFGGSPVINGTYDPGGRDIEFRWYGDSPVHDQFPSGTDPIISWEDSDPGVWDVDGDIGQPISLQNYINAVDFLDAVSTGTKAVFTTGPLDHSSQVASSQGFQASLKDDAIRAHVASDSDRVLFDYADIVSYNNAGVPATTTWEHGQGGAGLTYQTIHADNALPEEGSHINETAELRIGKATWWLLARIAGWDGTPA